MFCGISVFNIFSESISSSVGVIPGNQNYVKKVVFPLEILPVAAVLSALVFGLVSIAILLAGIGLFLHTLTITAICLPLILLPLLLFSTGLAWFVASLGTYFRDLQHAIGILLQMLFFMTPIFYKIEQLPESFRFFLQLNPLASVIQQSRRILIFGQWPAWGELLLLIGISLLIFQLGYIWFMKTKRGFADVL
jgi:lipopolysaccharide transport system permease protein